MLEGLEAQLRFELEPQGLNELGNVSVLTKGPQHTASPQSLLNISISLLPFHAPHAGAPAARKRGCLLLVACPSDTDTQAISLSEVICLHQKCEPHSL